MGLKLYSEPLCFSYSLIYTSLTMIIPQLFLRNVCHQSYGHMDNVCSDISKYPDIQREVQQSASFWTMVYHLTTNIIGFFAVLIWGPATDIVGRKVYLAYTCIVMIIMNVALIFSIEVPSLTFGLCILAAVLNGSYGDMSGTISMCYTVMADVTDEGNRTLRMGILGSMFFLSYGVGGLLTGLVNRYIGFIFNPVLNIVLITLSLIYIIYFIEINQQLNTEKIQLLEKEKDQGSKLNRLSVLNPFPHLKEVIMVVYEAKRRYFLIFMYFIYFGSLISISADHYLVALFMKNEPFNASPDLVGYYIGFIGFTGFIGALISVFIAEKLQVKDEPLLKFALFCQFIACIVIGAVRTNTGLFLARLAQIPTPIALTTTVSYTTKFADNEKRFGSILAGLHSLDVLTAIMASFLVGVLYNFTLHIYSGTTYLVLGGINVIVLIAFIYLVRQANKIDWTEDRKNCKEITT